MNGQRIGSSRMRKGGMNKKEIELEEDSKRNDDRERN
jgi:hypothetical protein